MDGAVYLPRDPADWVVNKTYLYQTCRLVLEYRKGDIRRKMKAAGVDVVAEMPQAYGYVLGTTDQHGEELDCYVNEHAGYNDLSMIYVIDQIVPQTKVFDEHKLMFGFASAEEALQTYYDAFKDGSGPSRAGAIVSMTVSDLEQWIQEEGATIRPASLFGIPDVEIQTLIEFSEPLKGPITKARPVPDAIAGGVIVPLPNVSNGPMLEAYTDETGRRIYEMYLFGPIVGEVWSNTIDTFVRICRTVKADAIIIIHIASPGGSVALMGRMCSAIRASAGHVITVAEGPICSAATTVWGEGHTRIIEPGAYFMQHMSSQMLTGVTTDIQSRAKLCMDYVNKALQRLTHIGLFTEDEVRSMGDQSADIYVSGRTAISRVGVESGEPMPSYNEEVR